MFQITITTPESYHDGSSRRSRTSVHIVTIVVGPDKRRLLQAVQVFHVENITGNNFSVIVNSFNVLALRTHRGWTFQFNARAEVLEGGLVAQRLQLQRDQTQQ